MVLVKEKLIGKLQPEVHILLHLVSKVDPARLDHRPTPSQRGLLELLMAGVDGALPLRRPSHAAVPCI